MTSGRGQQIDRVSDRETVATKYNDELVSAEPFAMNEEKHRTGDKVRTPFGEKEKPGKTVGALQRQNHRGHQPEAQEIRNARRLTQNEDEKNEEIELELHCERPVDPGDIMYPKETLNHGE